MVNNPNSVLVAAIGGQTIKSTVVLEISSDPAGRRRCRQYCILARRSGGRVGAGDTDFLDRDGAGLGRWGLPAAAIYPDRAVEFQWSDLAARSVGTLKKTLGVA